MSDPYSTPSDEGGIELPVDLMKRRAQVLASQHAESNPDEAARALQLSDATGIPSGVVGDNLKEVDAGYRSSLTTEIVGSNGHLQDYINSHPLAAKLSNDDWHNLSALSDSLKKMEPGLAEKIAEGYGVTQGFLSRVQKATDPVGILGAVAKGVYESSDFSSPPGGYLKDTDIVDYRLASAVVSGSPVGVFLETMSRVFTAGLGGVKGGANEFYKQLTGDESGAEKFSKEITGIAEWYFMRGDIRTGAKGMLHEPLPKEVGDFLNKINPYVKTGTEPPVGLHPLVDEAKSAQAKLDVENLDEMLKAAKQTATGERSSQALQDFMELRYNPEIGISAEAVRKLYGDKLPEEGDGILGFIPRLAEQLQETAATGGDITVPRSAWLAHVEPEIAKALRDDLRVRASGVTLNEAKEIKELWAVRQALEIEAYHGTPHDFSEFDLSKIGTGEGQQAKGHGFYFAENKEVAGTYERRFTEEGKDAQTLKVKIKPDKEEFLDHDKLLGEQLPEVKEKLKPIIEELKADTENVLDPEIKTVNFEGMSVKYLQETLDQYFSDDSGAAASRRLNEAGIPGLRYLDEGSRIEGKGTHNLVVFDPKNVEITEKGGKPFLLPPLSSGNAAVDSIRASSALEPMFDTVREKKLTLQRRESEQPRLADSDFHELDFVDVQGKPAINATVSINPKDPTTLYVEMISAVGETSRNRFAPNEFGYRIIRDIFAQLKQEFNVTHLEGFRVSGARDKAGTYNSHGAVRIALDNASDESIAKLFKVFRDEESKKWVQYSDFPGEEVYGRIPDKLSPEQEKILAATKEVVQRLVGGKDKTIIPVVGEIRTGDRAPPVQGTFIEYKEHIPVILVALSGDHPLWTGRHEALHFLRRQSYIKDAEWETLTRAARDNGWKKLYDIDKRYSHLSEAGRLEEAIAEAIGEWGSGKVKVEGKLAAVFEKIKAFVAELRDKLKDIRGKDLTAEQLFERIERGDIGKRTGTEPQHPGVFRTAESRGPSAPELPGMTRMEDREIFEAAVKYGISAERYKAYIKKVELSNDADVKKQHDDGVAEERKKQSAEWKANRAVVENEVRTGLSQRPDVNVDEFLRTGMLYGEKLDKRYKIGEEYLTAEEKAVLPKEWVAEDGIRPDDLGSMFGYTDGKQMLDSLTTLTRTREESGLQPRKFLDEMVKLETDREMEKRYGNLEKNILEEAKEHVLEPTQLDALSQDTLFLAEKAKIELPLTGAALRKQALIEFNSLPSHNISSAKFLALSGRSGRAAEMALLKDKFSEAFKLAQMREHAAILAAEAKKFEREQESMDKTAKSFRPEVVRGVEQAYTNFVHALLDKAGYKIKQTPDEVARDIQFQGYKNLDDFMQFKSTFGYDFYVPENYLPKHQDAMTVGEFREFKDAVESLRDVGRAELKIDIAGEKKDFADWKKEAIEGFAERPLRDITTTQKGGNWLYRLDAPFTRMEEIFKDLDMRKELGPFWSALILPFELSKSRSFDMLSKLSADLKAIPGFKKKWQQTLSETIPHDFVWDSWNETPFKLTRWNMIKMMLNWGNESNARALAHGIAKSALKEGEKPTPEHIDLVKTKIEQLFEQHAKKEDWSYVQAIWDVFKGWEKDADTISRNVSGKGMKLIEPREFTTKTEGVDQTLKGGYFPLIPDKLRKIDKGIPERGQYTGDGPLGNDYFRAVTNQSHFIERTKANYFVDIDAGPEQLIGRMQQVIHDISYRDFVVNAGKVIYDTEIQNAIQKRYGIEYQKQMEPWLKRIANQFTAQERELQGWNDILKRFRMNLLAAALPLNYSVMLSPSVGTLNLKNMLAFNLDRAASKKLVMDNSKELKHMLYNLDRDILEQMNRTIGTRGWSSYQLQAMETMFKPLLWMEQQFRMNTFYGKFMEEKAKGRTDYEASALADSIVRERHGVAHVGDLPALMANKNEFVKLSTLFMGYFTSQRNWLRQVPEQARQREYSAMAKTLWGTVAVATLFNAALFQRQKRDEGMFSFLSKSLLSVPMQMVPLLRDGWGYYSEGYKSSTPLQSLAISVGQLGKDGWNITKGKKVKDPVKHAFDVLGTGVGLPGATQMGRTLDFLNDVNRGQQRPRDLIEWMRGAATGESLLKKR